MGGTVIDWLAGLGLGRVLVMEDLTQNTNLTITQTPLGILDNGEAYVSGGTGIDMNLVKPILLLLLPQALLTRPQSNQNR